MRQAAEAWNAVQAAKIAAADDKAAAVALAPPETASSMRSAYWWKAFERGLLTLRQVQELEGLPEPPTAGVAATWGSGLPGDNDTVTLGNRTITNLYIEGGAVKYREYERAVFGGLDGESGTLKPEPLGLWQRFKERRARRRSARFTAQVIDQADSVLAERLYKVIMETIGTVKT